MSAKPIKPEELLTDKVVRTFISLCFASQSRHVRLIRWD